MLKELTTIANYLDSKGLSSYADEIDGLMISLAGSVGKGTGFFIEDLKAGLTKAVNSDVFPNLTQEALNDVFRAIDILVNHGRDYVDASTYDEMGGFFEKQEEGIIPLVDEVVGLEGSMVEAHKELKEADPNNEESLRMLQRELANYNKHWEELKKRVNELRAKEPEKYQKFEETLLQKRKELGWV